MRILLIHNYYGSSAPSGENKVFEAGNVEACAAAIQRLLSRPDYDEMCAAAKHGAETKYSEEANYKRLMEIYGEVI